ncbi:hypothetical protein DQ04_02281060 [Trypanosoma grayi]|uniref:hypothetical protein n=1 Tax=Trypanosoma grayi TaxID=71804 RepID=UPI0004F48FB2|nr:hypothetical protein DQ04_02281060 [Trypanosoma grayi]KEG11788.1 hypothetical protein DQ04_02281060 [Trypanosoma grayi]
MLERGRHTLETTVEKLLLSVNVTPDCEIEAHLSGAERDVSDKLTLGTRIVGIDGQTVTDSGELRELLLSRDSASQVTVSYEKEDDAVERVNISGSVRFDGVTSAIAPQRPRDAVLDHLIQEPALDSAPKQKGTSLQSLQESSPTRGSLGTTPRSSGCNRSDHFAARADGEEDSVSVASFSEFTTELRKNEQRNTSDPAKTPASTDTPALLEFDKLDMPARTAEVSKPAMSLLGEVSPECSVRQRIMRAISAVGVGACVICVCQDVNPIAEIELVAMTLQVSVIAVNLGVKLRFRPKPEAFAEQFKAAMKEGAWFVIVNAHKSIGTCRVLEELVKDAESRNFEGFSPAARIIICLEPHPHFPRYLIKRAEVTGIQSSLSGSSSQLSMSVSRNRLVTAESMCSRRTSAVGVLHVPASGVGASSDSGSGTKPKRRVRISAAVDVVDIAPREVVAPPRERSFLISGSVALRAAFTGVPNDKFLCVSTAGEAGRFAVGSSMGNVYFVDELGNSLMQAHAHEASIWDLSFNDKYHFATGCEDGTSIEWAFELGGPDGALLAPSSLATLGNDVYCLTYLRGKPEAPLLIGGLSCKLMVHSANGVDQCVSISSNAQVMDCFSESPIVLVGGSDGSVAAVDAMTATVVTSFKEHLRKLPALTIHDESNFFTGSFDSTILSWDYRAPPCPTGEIATNELPQANSTHTLKLKNYVTGLHVDDVHLAASVGENLYLWDVRKLSEVLGGYPQAWRGLSRGIRVHSAGQCVVTASQDGYVRFWSFV